VEQIRAPRAGLRACASPSVQSAGEQYTSSYYRLSCVPMSLSRAFAPDVCSISVLWIIAIDFSESIIVNMHERVDIEIIFSESHSPGQFWKMIAGLGDQYF
jgi:hypothetical protein